MAEKVEPFRDRMFYRFALYGFLKNLRFFEIFIILFFISLGLSYTAIGILIAIQMGSTTLMELPTGVIADIYGRRKSMVFSFLCYIAAFLILALTVNYGLFAIAMFLYGLGDAFRTGTHKAMILEYLKLRGWEDLKVEYYGRTRSYSQMGSAVNSLLSAAIFFITASYQIIFILATVPYIIDLLNVGTYPPELEGEIATGNVSLGDRVRTVGSEFRHMLTSPRAFRGLMNSSIYDGFFEVAKQYLQPVLKAMALALPVLLYLSGQQRTAVVVGGVYFFIYILTSMASRSSGKITARIGNLKMAINLSFIAGGILLLLAGIAYDLPVITGMEIFLVLSVLMFLLLYVLKNIRRPMNVSYISDQIASKTMASGLSMESVMKTLIASFTAPVVGYFADTLGIGTALMILGLTMLILYPIAGVK